MTEMRTWRVSIMLSVPTHFQMPPDGNPPQVGTVLVPQSRMPAQAKQFGNITIAIRKGRYDSRSSDPRIEAVELVADIQAAEPQSVIIALGPAVEALIDLMSFEMGAALALGPTTITDITPPLTIGERRDFYSFATAPFDMNARAIEMQSIRGLLVGRFPESLDIVDSRLKAALRWFTKSLHTDVLHDQFIFLWIALEILCDASSIKIEEPYTCRNGHAIETCPTCKARTTKPVRGATIRAFLCSCRVSDETSKELWKVRQIMHGAIPFDSEKLAKLDSLVQELRAVVVANLKYCLGKQVSEPPLVANAGLTMHPAVSVFGTTPLAGDDISALIQ